MCELCDSGEGVTRRRVLEVGAGGALALSAAPLLSHLGGFAPSIGASETHRTGPTGPTGPSGATGPLGPDESGVRLPAPRIYTRAEWGANESIRIPDTSFAAVSKLIVHHTVTPSNPTDSAAAVRSIYEYHVTGRGYNDIAYNFLIDHRGRIYEGRWAREYAPGEVHDGEDSDGLGIVGAHSLNHNTGSIGIAFIGTFTSALPTSAALDALVGLLAWRCSRWGIDPLGSDLFTNALGETEVFANILGHREVRETACPGLPVHNRLAEIRAQVATRTSEPVVATASASLGIGQWMVGTSGWVAYFGSAEFQGTLDGVTLNEPIVGMAATPTDEGYWLVASDGGIFAFGDAPYRGSTGAIRLNKQIVGMARTPSGAGYWLVATDGGIFSFGNASFYGSTGGIALNEPIVGMAPTPSGEGYWLVASDGGIFCFGDASFYGSTGAITLAKPIVGMAGTPKGTGYWLVASDGGIFCFGDATFHGSAGALVLGAPVVGMAGTPSGNGYGLAVRDGRVLRYGDADANPE